MTVYMHLIVAYKSVGLLRETVYRCDCTKHQNGFNGEKLGRFLVKGGSVDMSILEFI